VVSDLQHPAIRPGAEKEPILNVRPQAPTFGRRSFSRAIAIGAVVASAAIGVASANADSIPWPAAPADGTQSLMSVQMLEALGDTPTTRYVLGTRVLRKGMLGTDVRSLQILLRRRGHKIRADGDFGRLTHRAVKRFQKRYRLKGDGVVGPRTMAKLGVRRIRTGTTQPPPPVVNPGNYPLTGPNAARAKYLKAFPVAGKHTYFNDFGAPRGQGSHQGNDIMAARGIPVRAPAAGTIWKANRVESGLGGIYVWLEDAKGTDYYFAHLNAIARGIKAGSVVKVDARYGATHLHFEIRPEGVGPINPYTDLLAVDPEPPVRN
jgi:peptidoglycan hydrolase-like protein with peptidoglycan-binding domain